MRKVWHNFLLFPRVGEGDEDFDMQVWAGRYFSSTDASSQIVVDPIKFCRLIPIGQGIHLSSPGQRPDLTSGHVRQHFSLGCVNGF